MGRKPQNKPPTRKEKRAMVIARLKQYSELGDRTIARQLGVSHSFVGAIRRELGLKIQSADETDYLSHPYLIANPHILDNLKPRGLTAIRSEGVLDLMQERGISAVYAQTVINKAKKDAKKSARYELADGDIVLKCDDITIEADKTDKTKKLIWIADNSIDLMLVDPPYDSKSVSIYQSIAEIAARVLKPHGILLILTGQAHLDKVIREINRVKGIRYNWLLALISLQGGSKLIHKRGVTPYHKPVLIYTKGPYEDDIFSDIAVIAAPPDKTREKYHKFEQDVSAMSELIYRFSVAGMTVLDCCMGSGTTGVAAVKLERKFIGVDIDKANVEIARSRITEAMTEREHGG